MEKSADIPLILCFFYMKQQEMLQIGYKCIIIYNDKLGLLGLSFDSIVFMERIYEMYINERHGIWKHIDFVIIDAITIVVSFVLAFYLRHGKMNLPA